MLLWLPFSALDSPNRPLAPYTGPRSSLEVILSDDKFPVAPFVPVPSPSSLRPPLFSFPSSLHPQHKTSHSRFTHTPHHQSLLLAAHASSSSSLLPSLPHSSQETSTSTPVHLKVSDLTIPLSPLRLVYSSGAGACAMRASPLRVSASPPRALTCSGCASRSSTPDDDSRRLEFVSSPSLSCFPHVLRAHNHTPRLHCLTLFWRANATKRSAGFTLFSFPLFLILVPFFIFLFIHRRNHLSLLLAPRCCWRSRYYLRFFPSLASVALTRFSFATTASAFSAQSL
jgi:hypothetical protein